MKITSGMLPFEVVQEVRDIVKAQVALDRQELALLSMSAPGPAPFGWLPAILKYGAEDRKLLNQAIADGSLLQGECYQVCHHCCGMTFKYEVEAFDILLSYSFNPETVNAACRAGQLEDDNKWCGLLEDGLCTIHYYKPYTCLLTVPSPKGAEKGGCCFKGDKNAQTSVHKLAMIVTGRLRTLFKEYLPELPEFAGENMNQAFKWAVHHMRVGAII